jgi:hypothetical protein
VIACVASLGLVGALSPVATAQRSGTNAPLEAFAKIDPYTKGERTAIDRAGYVSFGPFPWCTGSSTADVAEALGTPVLWVETAHFKLGSTLETYSLRHDKREEKRLASELERLRAKLGDVRAPKGKLDPWLRLHLYALRLEDLYAGIQAQLGVTDDDFVRGPGAPMNKRALVQEGEPDCPFLGQPSKPTVLLTEKSSSLGRFSQRWLQRDVTTTVRGQLPGRSMFVGISVEQLQTWGYEFDIALHCALAHDLELNLLDGFNNNGYDAPYWFKQGLAHVASRTIDERFTIFAAGTTREHGDEDKPWEPRVYGLVFNQFVPAWEDSLRWEQWSDLDTQAHLVVWSRVAWLLQQKDCDIKRFWSSVTSNLLVERVKDPNVRQLAAFTECFGRSPQELDAAWRAFVLKSYAKR